MQIEYFENQMIRWKGELYLIVQIVELENYIGLVCQRNESNRIETIEIPKEQ